MQRLWLSLCVCALVLPAAAIAGVRASGDGTLVVKNGSGQIKVQGRGTIFGHFDRGSLRVVDWNPDDDKDAQVNGVVRAKPVSDTTTLYNNGKDVRFLFSGGKYTVVLSGVGIDLSAVGKGTATLVADQSAADVGAFEVNGGKFQPLPAFVPANWSFGATTANAGP